jgi:hypothetical protein
MRERRKRVKRGDGSVYRSKNTRRRWGARGCEVKRGREREKGRDWSGHEGWVKPQAKSVVVTKRKKW